MSKQLFYTFAVITHGANGPGDLKFEKLFSTRNEGEVAELTRFLLEQNAGFRRTNQSRNVRGVLVTHVDPKEAQEWQTTGGRNGLKSKPVLRGQRFRSATEASGHVGLRHNEVAMLLSRCQSTGEKQATVRGVTFAYADDVPELK